MKHQATRIHPPAPTERAEIVGVVLTGLAFVALLALFHRFTWAVLG